MKTLLNLLKTKKLPPGRLNAQVVKTQEKAQNDATNSDLNSNLSPNLLSYKFSSPTFYLKHQNKINKIIKTVCIFMQAFFIVVIAVNFFLNARLESETNETTKLKDSFEERRIVLEELETLNKRIALYKEVQSGFHAFGNDVDTILIANSRRLTISSISFEVPKERDLVFANIGLSTSDPLLVVSFITNLVKNASVSAVSITSATLDSFDESYKVTLEVKYVY